jgi:hypothetical protein
VHDKPYITRIDRSLIGDFFDCGGWRKVEMNRVTDLGTETGAYLDSKIIRVPVSAAVFIRLVVPRRTNGEMAQDFGQRSGNAGNHSRLADPQLTPTEGGGIDGYHLG